MEEQLISFKTAKLAKEKGFDWSCKIKWSDGNVDYEEDYFFYKNNPDVHPCPTQSLLQKWLREEHDIHILVDRIHQDKLYWYGVSDDEKSWETSIENSNVHEYNSYEEALEMGLKEALKLIKTD